MEKPEEGEATGCRLCKHCAWWHAEYTSHAPPTPTCRRPGLEITSNFAWPKIVPGRRRCPLVRRLDKGDFTVFISITVVIVHDG